MGNVKVLAKTRSSPRSKEKIREENERIILIAAEKVFAKHGLKGAIIKINKDKNKLGSHNFAQTISNFFIHANKNKY